MGDAGGLLFLDDLPAQVNALVANIHATWPGDQPLHLILTLAAKRAAIGHAGTFRVWHMLPLLAVGLACFGCFSRLRCACLTCCGGSGIVVVVVVLLRCAGCV